MKILKKILIVLGIIIAIPLAIAIFLKKEYIVERDVIINQPKQVVFDYIKFLKNQDSFSKWANMDPGMKKTYTGTDGTVGFVSAWESTNEQVGIGEQEIKKITEGDRVDFELRFKVPFEATEAAYMTTTEAGDNKTKVLWGFHGRMSYPMNIMLLFMDFDKMLGDDLSAGLSGLKTVMEK